jgi:hypothetical protein
MERACDPIHKEYAATLVALGKESGFAFTPEDVAKTRLAQQGGELDDSQLDQVAGGASLSLASYSTVSPTLNTSTLNLKGFKTTAGVT